MRINHRITVHREILLLSSISNRQAKLARFSWGRTHMAAFGTVSLKRANWGEEDKLRQFPLHPQKCQISEKASTELDSPFSIRLCHSSLVPLGLKAMVHVVLISIVFPIFHRSRFVFQFHTISKTRIPSLVYFSRYHNTVELAISSKNSDLWRNSFRQGFAVLHRPMSGFKRVPVYGYVLYRLVRHCSRHNSSWKRYYY